MNRTKIAAVLFWFGALGLTGMLISPGYSVLPGTIFFTAILMAPYLYINFQRGRRGMAETS